MSVMTLDNIKNKKLSSCFDLMVKPQTDKSDSHFYESFAKQEE